jgi:hypothetical protein
MHFIRLALSGLYSHSETMLMSITLLSYFFRGGHALFLLFVLHFLLKCLYQVMKVSGHVFVCWGERTCIFVLRVSILSLSTIFLLDFGTVLTAWKFICFSLYCINLCILMSSTIPYQMMFVSFSSSTTGTLGEHRLFLYFRSPAFTLVFSEIRIA